MLIALGVPAQEVGLQRLERLLHRAFEKVSGSLTMFEKVSGSLTMFEMSS
jgi:hypothetical protein